MKLLLWLPALVATILGIVEVAVKFLKELLTLIVTLLFPVIPSDKFKAFVTWLRGWVDKLYDLISKYKGMILKAIGAI